MPGGAAAPLVAVWRGLHMYALACLAYRAHLCLTPSLDSQHESPGMPRPTPAWKVHGANAQMVCTQRSGP
eukprot:scaffold1862_cov576-Prasinococcus_capsulatus_cf.AAC.2